MHSKNPAHKIKVGISVGDLNGIGSEVIFKTFQDQRMFDFCTPILFASIKTMLYLKKKYNIKVDLHSIHDLPEAIPGKINILNVWKENVTINLGQESQEIGEYAVKSLKAATTALKNDMISVLVTAPIHKYTVQSEDYNFAGHTDFLNQELEGNSLMFMISDALRVGLLTDHLALKDIANTITPELITKKIDSVYHSLQQDFAIIKPKIAVLGLNPHSGDNGLIGKEDTEIIKPTIETIHQSGKLVYGPYAADSFFGSQNYKSFDAVVATYHDQGLIPFKTLSFGTGVNYTAGLNKIRTSPDHGTGFDIAGKNIADHSSFSEAVFTAIRLYKNREDFKELSRNPLKIKERKRRQNY